jgi:hypothetical protein
VTLGPTVSIWFHRFPEVLRSILNPSSLLELSVQDRSISRHPVAVAVRFDGADGVGLEVGVGVGVGVEVAVGVGVGVAVALGVGVGLGLGVAVGVGVPVGRVNA